jgi:hypothetical protein
VDALEVCAKELQQQTRLVVRCCILLSGASGSGPMANG